MERYLTKKCRPGKGVKLLENTAMILCFGLFAACVAATVFVVAKALSLGMLGWQNFLLLIPAVLLAVAMNAVGERMRARKHAQVIVRKLQEAGRCVPADEAESLIGVRKAAQTALTLVEKGYLTDVRLAQGFLLLGDAEAPVEKKPEAKQLFHDVEV